MPWKLRRMFQIDGQWLEEVVAYRSLLALLLIGESHLTKGVPKHRPALLDPRSFCDDLRPFDELAQIAGIDLGVSGGIAPDHSMLLLSTSYSKLIRLAVPPALTHAPSATPRAPAPARPRIRASQGSGRRGRPDRRRDRRACRRAPSGDAPRGRGRRGGARLPGLPEPQGAG